MRVTRPAPLGKGGVLLPMEIPLVSKELALVEQKVLLGRAVWCPSGGGSRDRFYCLVSS